MEAPKGVLRMVDDLCIGCPEILDRGSDQSGDARRCHHHDRRGVSVGGFLGDNLVHAGNGGVLRVSAVMGLHESTGLLGGMVFFERKKKRNQLAKEREM